MKHFLLALLACGVFSIPNFGQKGWTWQNPKPDGNTLNDVSIFGNGYAVSVGYQGLILRSADNGESWSKIESGITSILYGVSMNANGTGWVVGVPGAVLKTTDNGLTWTKQVTGNPYSYYAVATNNANDCLVGGYTGTMYISNDGGTNWINRPTNSAKAIRSIFLDPKGMIYTGHDGGIIQRSADNGVTWQTLPSPLTTTINDIKFIDSLGIAVSTGGKILRTVDRGITWTLINASNPYNLNTVSIIDIHNVIIMGATGQILNSSDGGVSYTVNYLSQDNAHPINAVVVKPNNFYLCVGDFGLIAKSQNRLDWTIKTDGFLGYIYDICFTDTLQGFAAGSYHGILKTVDGGETWAVKNQSIFHPDYRTLFFLNRSIGFAASNSNLFKTTDSGETWTKILSATTVPAISGMIYSIFFLTQARGWIVTDNGNTYKTLNGGTTWVSYPSGVTKVLTEVIFKDTLNGFVTGWGGTFLRTRNGGATWTQQNTSFTTTLSCMYAFNLDTLIVAGASGKVYKTADGGENWNAITMPPSIRSQSFVKVRFINETTGWLCGSQGAILKTKDGGDSWSLLPTNVAHDLFSFSFTDEHHIWAAGMGGTIIKTTDGGGTSSVETHKIEPSGFSLVQNYPNPFSESTTLKYILPKRSPVKLEIYSITGVKMATLVNVERDAGEYQITIDGNRLPGGIYFCRLTWGQAEGCSIRILKN